jgi:hypothetical protein
VLHEQFFAMTLRISDKRPGTGGNEKRRPNSRRIAVRVSEMSWTELSAIQLCRQVARDFHARLRLNDRRLVPLTHFGFSLAMLLPKQIADRQSMRTR